ncbi:hypothetical protein RHMOL_Rhmol11G0067800 [Rhododendron molle]|uniref:Uncharacterized protein n=1 Tax=Rhododendron molle TaxID=49168 RepID=A0ACC0LQI0_RHOML|nr:hypothetical protein RHMOL_Rhmol11G0067800 [Rhododendron molle]
MLPSAPLLCLSFLCVPSVGLITPTTCSTTIIHFTNETDRQALLAIKDMMPGDPLDFFSSWNNSVRFCNWKGVTCDRLHQRVIELNLSSTALVGSLSPHGGNLTFLRTLVLDDNNIRGLIPEEIGRLFRLRILSLWNNSFEGKFPANVTHCPNIMYIGAHNMQ